MPTLAPAWPTVVIPVRIGNVFSSDLFYSPDPKSYDTIEKMKARVEYDLEYLRNWSLGLDLQIIVRTIRLVFFDRNAY